MSESSPALELTDLDVAYRVRGKDRPVLRGLSLSVARGQSYGLVGESGCGKSTAALAIVRYLPRNGRVRAGAITVAGTDVLRLRGPALRAYHARQVSMVYQNPAAALNPAMRIGGQIAEAFTALGVDRADALDRARDALARVQIADPGSVMRRYPHQLSGGMQQRVLIAMALAKHPELLVLDEPTTGLDATVEAEVLDLVEQLQADLDTAVLFISHNLGVIARMCSHVGVLYAGSLVEEGPVETVLAAPRHPYTVGLLRCIPRRGARKALGRLDTIPGFLPSVGADLEGCVFVERCALSDDRCRAEAPPATTRGPGHVTRCWHADHAHQLPPVERGPTVESVIDRTDEPLVRLDGVSKVFRQHEHDIQALREVSAVIWPGETLGLVGESGCGKTTLARTLLGIVAPSTGVITLDGRRLEARYSQRARDDLRALQIVFQNPDSALNRRHSVRRILLRSLRKLGGFHGEAAMSRLIDLAERVRLDERTLTQKPSQLSGGLKQRAAIARAFAGAPRLVICDEPTSSLDVSVQAAILNLLVELQENERVAYLFISHDLGVVRYISDRIAVLYLGRLMELGPAEVVFGGPHHPYTEALLSAVATVDGGGRHRIRLIGEIPSAAAPPSGCVFHTRCPRKLGTVCEQVEPPLVETEAGHSLRCHIPLGELRRLQTAETKAEAGVPTSAAQSAATTASRASRR
jgi:peptide/nickel transport system ATP-binding protein